MISETFPGWCLKPLCSVCLSPSRGRLWDCMRFVLRRQDSVAELGASIMQQADVAALWLLEALVLTLPQSLLQAYIIVSTDVGLISPGQILSPSHGASSSEDKASHFLFSLPVGWSCGLCLLSISWALVLYNRACCLIRPGHLAMPPAAMLCQLVWRVGMLGTRVACLMLFARVFNWWVCGVAGEQVTHLQAHCIVCNVPSHCVFLSTSPGFHWLTASFWLVSQQPDICAGPWCWRAFNAILGLIHVFLFLNVKDGPSRFRMASFYAVRRVLIQLDLSLSASLLCMLFLVQSCFFFFYINCMLRNPTDG